VKRQNTAPTAGSRRPNAAAGVASGPLDELVGYHLRRAQSRVFDDFLATVGGDGVTPGQFGVLVLIEANPGLSQSALAKALGIERSTMVAVIDRLERQGLVRRDPSASDRRSYALAVTAAGDRLLARLWPRVREHERRIAAGLDAGEQAVLIGLLRRIGGGQADGGGGDRLPANRDRDAGQAKK
jgi:DNA-binding MarR family transcriptional regulator